jgi:arsenite-transporting ATPase
MALTDLYSKSLQFILFGGKGGVGKTTMAATTAIELATEHKVLIFTTDPAPSLADSFGQLIGNEPTPIASVQNLFAMEINARKVMEEFKQQYGGEILDILQQGTYLADEETEDMFRLDIPGLDEMMSLKKIIDFMDSSNYQQYIVDTAPTGHTLRLLMLPELLDNWIKFLASLRWRYHAVSRQFSRENRVEKADEFLFDMKKTVKKVKALFQNAEKTEFVVVTIAEKMGISETEDLLRSLAQMHIPSKHIIINNIFPYDESHFMQARREAQEKYIDEIKKKFSTHRIIEVALQPTEMQGIAHLQQLRTQLFAQRSLS